MRETPLSFVVRRLSSGVGSLVLCLAILSCSGLLAAGAADDTTLMYAGEFGRFDDSGKVERIDLTTNEVMMTVALYNNNKAGRQALWCRRLAVPVWNGRFVAELDDALGVSDTALNPKYALLSEVFAAASPDDSWWVGVSRVRLGDAPEPPAGMDDTEKLGKLSAQPFAVEADRAAAARGDFTVTGEATVGELAVSGPFTATDQAAFAGNVVFQTNVVFGAADALTVVGTLSFSDLDLSREQTVFEADVLKVTKGLQAQSFTLEGGEETVLTSDEAFKSLRNVTVGNTLTATDGVTATCVTGETVIVAGTLTLPSGGSISWEPIGGRAPTLVATNGIYATALPVTVDVDSAGKQLTDTVSNATSKEQLVTLTTAAKATATVTVENGLKDQPAWCKAGPADNSATAAITVSSLCPFRPKTSVTESATVSGGTLLTHATKELSK